MSTKRQWESEASFNTGSFRLMLITILMAIGVDTAIANPLKLNKYKDSKEIEALSRKAINDETLTPYSGPSNRGADPSTLHGKVICGYQGWFRCKGDGSHNYWKHWSKKRQERPGPGNIAVDLWPDTSELDPDELYDTHFKKPDGSPYQLFSSVNYKTVVRHFKWMKEADIDGVFLYRFLNTMKRNTEYRAKNIVLHNVRAGANLYGRTYAVKYDVSSCKAGDSKIILDDWSTLVRKMHLDEDRAYQRHDGKMVLVLAHLGRTSVVGGKHGKPKTGITIEESIELVRTLQTDPKYGNPCIVLGTPVGWREQVRDCPPDPRYLDLVKMCDIIHPWSGGRYKSEKGFNKFLKEYAMPDLDWLTKHNKEYLPVVLPGFSRHNMRGDGLNRIPRDKGNWLNLQYKGYFGIGIEMMFQGIFDEVDEGTAIFKCSNNPPADNFITYEGLPEDFYLDLVGEKTKELRKRVVKKRGH